MTIAYRRMILASAALVIIAACASLPPVAQDPRYHLFAASRALLGIPNFWNVVSNAPFLLAALYGLRVFRDPAAFVERWECVAFAITIGGTAAVAAGSAFYHLNPTDATLFWDRLPVSIVFASLLAATIGERIDSQTGRRLLLPLLCFAALSVIGWRATGDLRAYAGVQFGSALLIVLLLALFPPRYTLSKQVWIALALYAAAKVVEQFDRPIATIIGVSGHPWKHVFAAAAIFVYVRAVDCRRLSVSRASVEN
jgi:hypothetical protein